MQQATPTGRRGPYGRQQGTPPLYSIMSREGHTKPTRGAARTQAPPPPTVHNRPAGHRKAANTPTCIVSQAGWWQRSPTWPSTATEQPRTAPAQRSSRKQHARHSIMGSPKVAGPAPPDTQAEGGADSPAASSRDAETRKQGKGEPAHRPAGQPPSTPAQHLAPHPGIKQTTAPHEGRARAAPSAGHRPNSTAS